MATGRDVPIVRALVSGRRTLTITAAAIALMFSAATAQPTQMSPQELMRRVAANEIRANNNPSLFMYKDTIQYKNRSITKQVIETEQGNLGRTITINGKPLSPDDRTKEDHRLEKFAHDPEARRKKQQSDKEDDQRAATMLTSLPDAFLFTYAGTEKASDGDQLVHLNFVPNPNFDPPNRETEVYVGMKGDVLVDTKALRIAKLDGTLFRDVNFGWGILGKLYKGGRFFIEQKDVGGGRWELTRETLQFSGKILLIKPLTIWSTETATDFHPVPAKLSTAQALDLLYKADDVMAQNSSAAASRAKHK